MHRGILQRMESTIVDDIVYIQRGYERFEEKTSAALVESSERVDSEKAIQKFKLKVG